MYVCGYVCMYVGGYVCMYVGMDDVRGWGVEEGGCGVVHEVSKIK